MGEPGLVVLPGPYGGHPGAVFAVGYSPDGSLLASGGWDGTVRLWNARDGAEISVLAGHAGPVRSVAFASDGTLLASCGRDRTIRLWDTVAVTSAGMLRGHSGTVLAVAFAPGRPLLASAGDDGSVRLWNPLDGAQIDELSDDARALAFSPEGDVLASAGRDGKIRLWRQGYRAHTTIGPHAGPVLSLAFGPARPLLASAGGGSVRLWNPLDGAQIDELSDDARALAFSPDGRTLASAGQGAGIVLWDLGSRSRRTQLEGTGRPHWLAFAPGGTQVASANDSGDVRLYDLAGEDPPASLAGHTCEILSVACSPDGTMLATGDVDGAIRIWETTRGALVRRLVADREWVRSLAFNRAGTLLAAAIGSRIHVWQVTRGFAPLSTLDLGQRPVTSVAFGPEGSGRSLLVSADDSGHLGSWNALDGSAIAASSPAVSVAVDPGGTMVVGVGGDGLVRRWDLDGLTARQEFSPALQRPRCVAVRPDGRALAGAGSDGTIMVWDAADSAQPVATLPGHEGAVRTLAFSPDGELLASAGDDGTIRLWDVSGGSASASRILIDRAGVVRSVAFAPDGTTLVSVGDDGRINQWNPLSGRQVRSGRRHARPLPSVPGIRSDEPSREDLLGVDADVEMLATLIAAASTEPPLAVALLGEWGAGKSSVMLQVQDAVDRLAARARGDAGDVSYASNVCQIRFNAWHYSDDEVWTGLIDHLFRKLAAADDDSKTPPDPDQVRAERDRLRRELADQRQRCAELDSQRHRMARGLTALGRTAWRNRRSLLLRALLTAVAFVFFTFQLLSSGLVTAFSRAWNLARAGQRGADWPANSLAEEARLARERLAALEDQLAQVDAAARLSLLLNRRADLDSYGGGRGLLGQVHRDLEQLSKDLDRLRTERLVAGQLVPPPLERVILYIDDLDRCPPARVVEVLAAVHLMLALPLFVVVVAVDPRWLLEALRHHYRDLFTGAFGPGDHPITPLDYLDKIFQIPFTVRSLSVTDAAGFLGSMLGRRQADKGARPASLASQATASTSLTPADSPASRHRLSQAEQPPQADRPLQEDQSGPADPLSPADRPSPARPAEAILARPGGLVLRAPETTFIARLGPLLSTPRAAKKLVNLYRLVRIGIQEEDLPTFIGLGGYQVVQILLAILVGTPEAASAIFTAIRGAAYDASIVNVVRAADPDSGPRVAGFIGDIRPQAHKAVTDIRAYQRWCPELARYSFYTRSL